MTPKVWACAACLALSWAGFPLQGNSVAAEGDAASGERLSIFCAYCHGRDGNPPDGSAPPLAGRSREELVAKIKGKRQAYCQLQISPMMMAFMAAGCYNDGDIEDLAAYFSRQAAKP